MGTKPSVGRKRTRYEVFLNFQIEKSVAHRIDRAAAYDHRPSRSDMARLALVTGLEELERRWQLDRPKADSEVR